MRLTLNNETNTEIGYGTRCNLKDLFGNGVVQIVLLLLKAVAPYIQPSDRKVQRIFLSGKSSNTKIQYAFRSFVIPENDKVLHRE